MIHFDEYFSGNFKQRKTYEPSFIPYLSPEARVLKIIRDSNQIK